MWLRQKSAGRETLIKLSDISIITTAEETERPNENAELRTRYLLIIGCAGYPFVTTFDDRKERDQAFEAVNTMVGKYEVGLANATAVNGASPIHRV